MDLLKTAQEQERASKLDPIVPVVTKTGALKMPRCGPMDSANKGGVIPVVWSNEQFRPVLHWTAEREGCVFYEDICAGRYTPVNGGQPVAAPEKFKDWQRAMEMMQFNGEGTPSVDLQDLPDDFYHPEVYARRRAYNGGVRAVKFQASQPQKDKQHGQAKRQ